MAYVMIMPFEDDGAGQAWAQGGWGGGRPPFEDDGAEQSYTWVEHPFEDDGAGQSYTWVEHPFEDDGAGQSFQPFPFVPFEG